MLQLMPYKGPQLRKVDGPQSRPKRICFSRGESHKVSVTIEVFRSNLDKCDQTLEMDFLLSASLEQVKKVVSEVLAWNPARILIVGGPHDSVLTRKLTVKSLTTGGRSYWCQVYHVR